MNLLGRLRRRARWEWHKWADGVYRRLVRPPYVMGYEECVDYILERRASVSRMGDGELSVIYGGTLGFQRRDGGLGERLKEVMARRDDDLLVCIPDAFEGLERYNEVERNFWRAHHYFNRRRWYRHLIGGKRYGSTFLSRFYSMEFDRELSSGRIAQLRRLWEGRDVIFVEGRDTKMGVGNDLFEGVRSVRRILCPSRDAFGSYGEILEAVKGIEHRPNDLYILALGPTATVLAMDLHDLGLQALDMGHMDIEYEWYRRGVKSKVAVTGKFSNEAMILGNASEAVTGFLSDDEYDRQVIAEVGEH